MLLCLKKTTCYYLLLCYCVLKNALYCVFKKTLYCVFKKTLLCLLVVQRSCVHDGLSRVIPAEHDQEVTHHGSLLVIIQLHYLLVR